jgi:hypothetical protein
VCMDENPCTDVLVQTHPNLTALWASIALGHVLDGNPQRAERTLRAIPRSERGNVSKALEDLQMMIGRLA